MKAGEQDDYFSTIGIGFGRRSSIFSAGALLPLTPAENIELTKKFHYLNKTIDILTYVHCDS